MANVGDSGCLRLSYRTALATSSPPSPGTAPSTTAAADADADADAAPGRLGLGIRRGDDDVAAAAGSKSGRRRRVRTVHTAKVGASEVGARVRGRSRGGLVAERLSRDHKPENKGELERIQAAGGIVFPLPRTSALGDGDGYREGGSVAGEAKKSKHGRHRAANTREQGLATARDFGAEVPRVWATNGEGPGLAMSRSIGDKVRTSTCTAMYLLVLVRWRNVCWLVWAFKSCTAEGRTVRLHGTRSPSILLSEIPVLVSTRLTRCYFMVK